MRISDWSSDVCSSDLDIAHDARGDLLAGCPLPSPLAWPLAYAWPVHRIGPDHQPLEQPAEPTLLLLRREPDGKVSFHVLSPLTFRLLERLEQTPDLSGREQLEGLASEAGAQDTGAFRSEEHTSELQSLMRTSYAVFCLNNKTRQLHNTQQAQ